MSEEASISISAKTFDGTIVTLRADTPQELMDLVGGMKLDKAKVAQNFRALEIKGSPVDVFSQDPMPKAVENVQQGIPGSQVIAGQIVGDSSDAFAQAAAGPAPEREWAPAEKDRDCKHGRRAIVHGVSAKGPWTGAMCAAPQEVPKNQKCKPIWKG